MHGSCQSTNIGKYAMLGASCCRKTTIQNRCVAFEQLMQKKCPPKPAGIILESRFAEVVIPPLTIQQYACCLHRRTCSRLLRHPNQQALKKYKTDLLCSFRYQQRHQHFSMLFARKMRSHLKSSLAASVKRFVRQTCLKSQRRRLWQVFLLHQLLTNQQCACCLRRQTCSKLLRHPNRQVP